LLEARAHLQQLEPGTPSATQKFTPELMHKPQPQPSAVLSKICALNLDDMTARDALQLLYQVQAQARDEATEACVADD